MRAHEHLKRAEIGAESEHFRVRAATATVRNGFNFLYENNSLKYRGSADVGPE